MRSEFEVEVEEKEKVSRSVRECDYGTVDGGDGQMRARRCVLDYRHVYPCAEEATQPTASG